MSRFWLSMALLIENSSNLIELHNVVEAGVFVGFVPDRLKEFLGIELSFIPFSVCEALFGQFEPKSQSPNPIRVIHREEVCSSRML